MRWEGGRVERWQGGKVVRWQGGRMMSPKDGRYLVLFKGGGHKMSSRFRLFVSDVNQRNEGVRWAQNFLA